MLNNISPKQLFLLDASGALLSIILGLILAQFEYFLGIPANILYFLSSIAIFYLFFSTVYFLQIVKNQYLGLKIIAIANFCYCGLSIYMFISTYENISWAGFIYFITEILIIGCLAAIEWDKAAHTPKSKLI